MFHGPVSLPDVPITRVRDLYSTFRNLIHEIAKFGIVGAFNYVVDAVLSNVFHFGIGLGPLTSKGLSTVIAATSSYFLNRHWTWRNRARTGLFREYRLFMALSAIALAITLVPLGLTYYVFGWHGKLAFNISANVIGVGLAMVFRFWSFKRWVFLAPPTADEPVPSPAEATARTTI